MQVNHIPSSSTSITSFASDCVSQLFDEQRKDTTQERDEPDHDAWIWWSSYDVRPNRPHLRSLRLLRLCSSSGIFYSFDSHDAIDHQLHPHPPLLVGAPDLLLLPPHPLLPPFQSSNCRHRPNCPQQWPRRRSGEYLFVLTQHWSEFHEMVHE